MPFKAPLGEFSKVMNLSWKKISLLQTHGFMKMHFRLHILELNVRFSTAFLHNNLINLWKFGLDKGWLQSWYNSYLLCCCTLSQHTYLSSFLSVHDSHDSHDPHTTTSVESQWREPGGIFGHRCFEPELSDMETIIFLGL